MIRRFISRGKNKRRTSGISDRSGFSGPTRTRLWNLLVFAGHLLATGIGVRRTCQPNRNPLANSMLDLQTGATEDAPPKPMDRPWYGQHILDRTEIRRFLLHPLIK